MRDTWTLAVFSEMKSDSPISRFAGAEGRALAAQHAPPAVRGAPLELEVEVALGLLSDLAVHRADVVAQLSGVDDGLCVCGHAIS
jgi:hypothetical protein